MSAAGWPARRLGAAALGVVGVGLLIVSLSSMESPFDEGLRYAVVAGVCGAAAVLGLMIVLSGKRWPERRTAGRLAGDWAAACLSLIGITQGWILLGLYLGAAATRGWPAPVDSLPSMGVLCAIGSVTLAGWLTLRLPDPTPWREFPATGLKGTLRCGLALAVACLVFPAAIEADGIVWQWTNRSVLHFDGAVWLYHYVMAFFAIWVVVVTMAAGRWPWRTPVLVAVSTVAGSIVAVVAYPVGFAPDQPLSLPIAYGLAALIFGSVAGLRWRSPTQF